MKHAIWNRRNVNTGAVDRIAVTVTGPRNGAGQVKVLAHFAFGDAVRWVKVSSLEGKR